MLICKLLYVFMLLNKYFRMSLPQNVVSLMFVCQIISYMANQRLMQASLWLLPSVIQSMCCTCCKKIVTGWKCNIAW